MTFENSLSPATAGSTETNLLQTSKPDDVSRGARYSSAAPVSISTPTWNQLSESEIASLREYQEHFDLIIALITFHHHAWRGWKGSFKRYTHLASERLYQRGFEQRLKQRGGRT